MQRDRHQQRLRRERVEQVGPIDSASQRRHDVLLGIVSRSGRLDVGVREVLGVALGDDGDADAAVERRQELRQRPAARLAAAADPFGVDFRARQQVVDPADAVPRAEQAEVGAEQNQAASGVFVLARSAARSRTGRGGCPGTRCVLPVRTGRTRGPRSLCAPGSRTASGSSATPCRSPNGRAARESPDGVPLPAGT